MWPIIIGIGILAFLDDAFSGESEKKTIKLKKKKGKRKIFISFAYEDRKYRNFLVRQANDERSPFEFVDMSVKEPWENHVWKRKCRSKIRQCDGLIILLSKNTWHSGGSRWEIKCAIEEGLKVIGMHIKKNEKGAIPPELQGRRIIIWNWENLEKFVKGL